MRRMVGIGLLLMVAAACAGPLIGEGDAPSSLAGTSWRLAELNGRAPVAGATVPTLSFGGDEASGDSGCNQFFGPYALNGATLRLGPLGATRRACVEEAANAQEAAYFRALDSTTRATVSAGVLVLYAGDQPVARFQRVDD
jgi:heat shock protein HslJ